MRKFVISDRFTVADIGLEIEGDSLTELFLAGAEGLTAIILGQPADLPSTESREFNLSADSSEQLLVDWLSELIYLFDAQNMVPVKYQITVEEDERFMLSGTVEFRIFNRETESAEHDIKAVTYYKLQIKKDDGIYRCHPVFDL